MSELRALALEVGDRALAALLLENTLLGFDVICLRLGVRCTGRLEGRRSGIPVRVENLADRRFDFGRRARYGKSREVRDRAALAAGARR